MGFAEATKNYFIKWVDFSSRISRSEYWWGSLGAILVSVVIGFAIGFIGTLLGFGTGAILDYASILLQIFLMIAGTALAVRRLHDLDRSGWWLLIILTIIGSFLLLYWYCCKGDEGENRFGPDPLAGDGEPDDLSVGA
ncbi:MAG TPA: DUF805 domain-containing protein [Gammaproteobacteria bacterium]|nr:DUF805 domain-containing protein [Gammaproteobacteria bacterium]|tara:strand:- start:1520 stop:1933 length:414 start_codon:yes stop_codon:yes gene_type:complete